MLGLATTSSVILGAVLGLYVPFPKKVLAGVLAFAAGSLIAALAIELGFEGASQLVRQGANVHAAWGTIAGGFAAGAILYYVTSLPRTEGSGVALSVAFHGICAEPQAPRAERPACAARALRP